MILALPVPYFEARGLGATYTPSQIQAMIVAQANAAGVPPQIALGVAAHESGFNPSATNVNTNGTTDYGVMQLNSTTVQTLGVSDPLDPSQNIDAGVGLLASYYAKYGDWNTALQAYAAGPGSVGSTPSSNVSSFINYVTGYTPPSGLDTSGGGSSFDFSTLGLPSFSLPDLSQSTIFPGVPDWVTWLGIAGVATVIAARA